MAERLQYGFESFGMIELHGGFVPCGFNAWATHELCDVVFPTRELAAAFIEGFQAGAALRV